jgi:hypothetical protein
VGTCSRWITRVLLNLSLPPVSYMYTSLHSATRGQYLVEPDEARKHHQTYTVQKQDGGLGKEI